MVKQNFRPLFLYRKYSYFKIGITYAMFNVSTILFLLNYCLYRITGACYSTWIFSLENLQH